MRLKKNAMNQIMFPMVDATDFATIESTVTASDFNSGATKKFYGVNHGGSVAFTSGAISKAATLVTSGIFQQTLKAAECNYDYLTYVFRKTGCADQILIFETDDVDPSDIYSQLSDFRSDISYQLESVIISNISDLDSQVLLNASNISDVESQVNLNASLLADITGQASVLLSNVSDLDSQVLLNASMISDVESQVDLNASLLADLIVDVSDVESQLDLNASNISDVESQVNLNASLLADLIVDVSDVESQLDVTDAALTSQFLLALSGVSDAVSAATAARSAALVAASVASDAHSLTLFTATYLASELSNVESQVDLNASLLADLVDDVSDVESQVDLNASMISDIQSQVDSGVTLGTSSLSDITSLVNAQMLDVMTVDTLADDYAADGAQPTFGEAILAIKQFLEERSVSGTTVTVKKPDGASTAYTLTINSDSTPTSITRD